jgi:formylglycine-generating enzyme required for sulfatase activity
MKRHLAALAGTVVWAVASEHSPAAETPPAPPPFYRRQATWQETMRASQEALRVWRQAPPAPAGAQPFVSDVRRGGDEPQPVKVRVAGWRDLYLIVDDAGDYHHDVANWAEARLVARDGGELFLDTVEPASAQQGWGAFKRDNKSTVGGPMQIAGRKFTRGLGTHARSVLHYRLTNDFEFFAAWIGVDASRRPGEGSVRFLVANAPAAVTVTPEEELWRLLARDFTSDEARRQMRWEREDRLWQPAFPDLNELAARYVKATRGPSPAAAPVVATAAAPGNALSAARENYYRSRGTDEARAELARFDFTALRLAIEDLTSTFGAKYPRGPEFLALLTALETSLRPLAAQGDSAFLAAFDRLQALRREALLANPLLDFDELLLVRRRADNLGLPANWQGNSSLPRTGFDNEIARLNVRELVLDPSGLPAARLTTIYRPTNSVFVGDLDLHFAADRLLFSSLGTNGRWQVFELALAPSRSIRQITPGTDADVDNYDGCYLPDGSVIFCSTASFAGVPCVDGSDHVGNLYVLKPDGRIRQLCFDQDHNWSPTMLANGRVLYHRWEYADTPHAHTRLLFSMNPDGTGQAEFYGSGSYWPNAMFYARPVPGHPTKVAAIVSGHHGVPRMGELVLFDPARGRREAAGVVQRIPGRGRPVEPVIRDQLVDDSWPKFLHPWPLNENYLLVSAKPTPQSPWGLYLADTFDNLLLLAELPGHALLEPTPLSKTSRPPVIPDRVDPQRKDALVYLQDIYQGDGLRGVPRGTVKALRVFAYHWAYRGMGGLLGTVGIDGPWDVRRLLGTVPLEPDGSAYFRVPANTPIAVQPLDAEGRALAVMRSWFTAMPGENLTCVGCHERQNTAPPAVPARAFVGRPPRDLQPWHGPPRGFSFAREVQPVLDRHCVRCHNPAGPERAGRDLPDFRGTERVKDFRLVTPGKGDRLGGRWTVGYANLHRYVRHPGIESDYHTLAPLEFHASTTELVQLLTKGHYDARLDAEDWDRLVTWLDLNAPFHGTWGEELQNPGPQSDRRRDLRRRYAGMEDDDTEVIPMLNAAAKPSAAGTSAALPPPTTKPAASAVTANGWPFDAAEAKRRQAAAGPVTARTLKLPGSLALDLVLVPAGEFLMGDEAATPDERPVTRVRLAQPFWMSRTEIRNDQFALFDASHDSHVESKTAYQFGVHGYPLNEPAQPVVRVSWAEAGAFCRWLSRATGETFTLPTEAQWEWAARAGAATAFSFGDLGADFSRHANLADAKLTEFASDPYTTFTPLQNPSPYEDYIPKETRFNDGALVTARVGSFAPNPWGLHDLHGNVWEWTLSRHHPYPYRADDGRNEPDASGKKVVRGGSWRDRPPRATSAYRLAYEPWQKVFNVGFRVVALPGGKAAESAEAPASRAGSGGK